MAGHTAENHRRQPAAKLVAMTRRAHPNGLLDCAEYSFRSIQLEKKPKFKLSFSTLYLIRLISMKCSSFGLINGGE